MTYQTLMYAVDGGVATLTLNRPSTLNAFDDTMTAELRQALRAADRDRAIRCIVLTGAGRGFSSGQDLKAVEARGDSFSLAEHLRQGYNRLIQQMVQLEKPIIGAINGVAAGAGCGIALATDIRIASDKASFLLAFSRVGLVPDSGTTWLLPRLVGYARAFEMAVMAEKVSADLALQWGLVNQVVPADQLAEVAHAHALRLASGPTLAFGLTKRAMQRALTQTLAEALEYEAQLQEIAGASEDRAEGVRAFLEKRTPNYVGR